MALNPAVHEMVASAVDSGRRSLAQREVLVEAIADEIHAAALHELDLDALALADMIVDCLEAMSVELPKPRLSVRAATQHTA